MIAWIKRLCCRMGWHRIGGWHTKVNDPLNFQVYARCKWCGFEGMIDSQGNLF